MMVQYSSNLYDKNIADKRIAGLLIVMDFFLMIKKSSHEKIIKKIG